MGHWGRSYKEVSIGLDYKNKNLFFKKTIFLTLPFQYNMSGIEVQHAGIQWVKEAVRKKYFNLIKISFDENENFNVDTNL